MKTRKFLHALFLLSTFSVLAALPAFAEDWKLSASATYESGSYGTNTTIETLYLPVTLKRYFDFGDISVTVPYVMLRSNGSFTLINGMPFKTKKQAAPVSTNGGLGDIILKGSFYALKDDPLDLYLVGKIKFPTADSNKGLGTGRYDETVGVELGKALSPEWSIFADGYYTFTGSPSGEDFKNIFSFDGGIADRLTESLTGSLFYYESTPLTSGNPDLREIALNFDYKITKEVHIFGGGLVGLTTSSPDYGVTGGVSFKF